MRFLTPKLREVDIKPIQKILLKEKPAQEAAQVCVHYYLLTFRSGQVAPTKNPPPQRWVKEGKQGQAAASDQKVKVVFT
jgi:hypothetical protein